MTHIVEMLRDKAKRLSKISPGAANLSNAAADEIERLRTELVVIADPTLSKYECHEVARTALGWNESATADEEQG